MSDQWEGTAFEGAFNYNDQTILHPLALIALIVLSLLMLFLPRRWAVVPFLILACFVSSMQRVAILSLDFDLIRIMVIVGFLRILVRKEARYFTWKSIDKMLIAWAISATIIGTLRLQTLPAFINRLGYAYDALGMYFFFRCLVIKYEDIERIILACIIVSIPVAIAFLIEKSTGRNAFAIFGGVPEITVVRMGRLRCQGAFAHAILAGCFWASLLPLMISFWWKNNNIYKCISIIGIITSAIIIFACSSSTPVMGMLSGLIGWLFFRARKFMRLIRWLILILLVSLHMVMKAPVWHLIARVSAVGGSTSWHRFNLIDQAINHFGEWFLLGVVSTANWDVFDITNHYILEGIRGGFLTFILFLAIIIAGFKCIGQLWRGCDNNPYYRAISWSLGVSLFVHCMNFIGVAYFGQIFMVWYLLLAMIGSLTPMKSTRVMLNKL